jgi:tRNA_anti-like
LLLPAGDDLAIVLFFISLGFGFGLETMKAETIVRKIAFAFMTTACLSSGVFWLQIKKVWPPFTEAATSVGTNPVAWFVVLMFILAVFAFHRPRNRNKDEISSFGVPPDPAFPAQKIFVDVSPEYLIDLYKDRTSVQGDALAAAYLSKWVSVKGKVSDISDMYGGGLLVIVVSGNEKIVAASFLAKEKSKISHIAHGATISVQGELAGINSYSIKLANCEMV